MNNVYMGLDVEDFIFGEGTTYGSNEVAVSDEEMNQFGVIECTDEPEVACYRIALENEQNYYAIMTAMMNQEYATLESTGAEMVYEGAKLDAFAKNLKELVGRFWAKAKGVFKRLMDQLSSIALSNKAFVKKYRPMVGKLTKPDDKDIKGYKFDTISIDYKEAALEAINVDKFDTEEEKKKLDKVRGKLVGEASVSADDFDKKLKLHLYKSEDKVDIPIFDNFGKLLDELENAATTKKAAKDAYKNAEDSVKTYLEKIKKLQKETDSKDAVDRYKAMAKSISKSITIMNTALSKQVGAITAKAHQDRVQANHWVRANAKTQAQAAGKKPEVQQSSADISNEFDVVLI